MSESSSGGGTTPPTNPPRETVLLNASAIRRALTRISHEIAERNEDGHAVLLMGIQKGGVPLSERIAASLESIWGHPVSRGVLDVSMHRDDLDRRLVPEVRPTKIPSDISGKIVVLVDDVLFSGRTVRAAMDALNGYGRPDCIQLAALVDRGHRELPIKADFVGKNIPTTRADSIQVRFEKHGGKDEVVIESKGGGS